LHDQDPEPTLTVCLIASIKGTTFGTRHRFCITCLNPEVFDDRTPFLGFGLHERAEGDPKSEPPMFGDAMAPQSLQCLPPQRKCSWVLGNME
jgi:hypothetical protein